MTRKDALLRLHSRLVTQRESLRGKIADDMGLVYLPDDGINDIGETASQMERSELHSQLAALESRELHQIEVAIGKLRNGTFGSCERCQKVIPIARLHALPFTSVCIECQRKRESRPSHDDEFEANWASAMDYERRSVDHEVSLNDLDAG